MEPKVLNGHELAKALNFVAVAMSKEQTRYYLNGVYFEKRKGEHLNLVATDGHRLHTYKIDIGECENFEFILPAKFIKLILPQLKKTRYATFYIEDKIGLEIDGISFYTKPVDGKFPDYRKVVPKIKKPKILELYNSKYLLETLKAFSRLSGVERIKTLGDKSSGSPVIITNDGAVAQAVIMPMRGDN